MNNKIELSNNIKGAIDRAKNKDSIVDKYIILLEENIDRLKKDANSYFKAKNIAADLLDKNDILTNEREKLQIKLNKTLSLMSKANEAMDSMRERHENDKSVIRITKYPEDDKRYENIMSHMDILWHQGETGPDGCGKCEDYRDILISAFDRIESMSSRNINKDFATKHINGDKSKEVSDNNNHIHKDELNGEIRGGDKPLDEFQDKCMVKKNV